MSSRIGIDDFPPIGLACNTALQLSRRFYAGMLGHTIPYNLKLAHSSVPIAH